MIREFSLSESAPSPENLKTREAVISLMRSSKNESEWNANCDKVKKVNGGYPEFWYEVINVSGLMQEVSDSWK